MLLKFLIPGLLLPGIAFAEPNACDLMPKADVERVTGLTFDDPHLRSEDACAGKCESLNGTACIYQTASEPKARVQIEVLFPPFQPGDWTQIDRLNAAVDKNATVTDLPEFGVPTDWVYSYNYGFLHYVDNHRLIMHVWEQNIGDNATALGKAKEMAHLILERLDAQ